MMIQALYIYPDLGRTDLRGGGHESRVRLPDATRYIHTKINFMYMESGHARACTCVHQA